MAAMTASDTPSAAAQRSDASSSVIRKGWSSPQHTLAAGCAHQQGRSARGGPLAQTPDRGTD